MATGFVQVPPDSTGKKVDCVSLSAGGQTVVRQTVVIADPTKSAGYAIVSGGQQLVKGTFTLSNAINISAMPALASGTNQIGYLQKISATVSVQGNVSLAAGTSKIGFLQKISASVTVQGNVGLNAGANNIGTINNISAPVVLAAGAANIGSINNISANVNVVLQTGANNIGTVNNISAPVVLAAGAANIGTINNISAAIALAAGTNMIGAVSVGAIASITAPINISAMPAVVLAAGAANIGTIQAISAVVKTGIVKMSASTTAANKTVQAPWIDSTRRQVVILNHPSLPPSATHGPKSVTLSASANTVLVASAGSANVYVDSLIVTSNLAAVTRCDVYTTNNSAAPEVSAYLAPGGGGFAHNFNPPWKISAGQALSARLKPSASAQVLAMVHFHTGVD